MTLFLTLRSAIRLSQVCRRQSVGDSTLISCSSELQLKVMLKCKIVRNFDDDPDNLESFFWLPDIPNIYATSV